ncbi:PA14 domain-containing protein [Hymenobacter terrenus]|uniref:PA14 domain-containing protein n=1 Tax=Hymenobacter terrenus TaxID=1629124 RepID=UPI000619744F|nr:PA14 domain-containing protein [Hymenobacter terrenus]
MLLLLLSLSPTHAQPSSTGDGLKGDYYNGPDFDQFVLSRLDANIDFNWAHQPPARGMMSEYFSIRWTGWLVPPASGRYVFHATVDDGIRIWLNDRLIMDEWRAQPVHKFTAAIELTAGEPYRLRVEYFEEIMDTRALLTWERPDRLLTSPSSLWRNLLGFAKKKPKPEPIPTSFLFSRNPRPAPTRATPAPKRLPKPHPKPPVVDKPRVAKRRPPPRRAPIKRRAVPPPHARPAPTRRAAVTAPRVAVAAPALVVADSGSSDQLLRLKVGETVTLPELYFNQGQAVLPLAARTALAGLAILLRKQPTLRFEVQGHTDNVGNAELNRQLSQQRAEAVCLYLTAHGVAPSQLRPIGYGGTRPVANNADPAQRPRNRRVVLQRL